MAESKAEVARERAGDETALAHRLLLEAVDCIAQASRLLSDERVSESLTDRAQELEQLAFGLPGSRR